MCIYLQLGKININQDTVHGVISGKNKTVEIHETGNSDKYRQEYCLHKIPAVAIPNQKYYHYDQCNFLTVLDFLHILSKRSDFKIIGYILYLILRC